MKRLLTAAPAAGLLLVLSGCESDPTFPSVSQIVWTDVTAGGFHSCGLSAEGQGYCWGSNSSGQLGVADDVSVAERPLRVAGLGSLRDIDAGLAHSCAVTVDGALYCWGSNEFGQLGIGITEDRTTPVAVDREGSWVAVSAGGFHTCALDVGGRVGCWGRNDRGQLGRPAGAGDAVPGPATTERRFISISAGTTHTCGVSTDGLLYCWGANAAGQLGLGSLSDVGEPLAVEPAFFTALDVAAGFDHTCAVGGGLGAYCWGNGELGQLGTDRGAVSTPVPVDELGTAAEVAVGGEGWSCGLKGSGEVVCWGFNPDLGLEGETLRVETTETFRTIDAGDGHLCGVDGDGGIFCWGRGSGGQLGTGGRQSSPVPGRVGG